MLFFADVSLIFESEKEYFYHFLCCNYEFRKSFCSKAFIGISLLDSLYWWQLSSIITRHFGHCKQEKRQIFMQQNTLFLNLFVLIIKQKTSSRETPVTCAQRSFFKKEKHLFRRAALGDCFWNIGKCSPLIFCHFTIFPKADPQRNCRSCLPDEKNTFEGLLLEPLK